MHATHIIHQKVHLHYSPCCMEFTLIHSTQYTVHSTQYTIHNTQYTVHSTQYTIHSTQIHSTQCTVRSTQYTVHNIQYTVRSSTINNQHVQSYCCQVSMRFHGQIFRIKFCKIQKILLCHICAFPGALGSTYFKIRPNSLSFLVCLSFRLTLFQITVPLKRKK